MQIDLQPARRVRRSGFTLIEMVVVITVLVILAGMIIAKLDVFDMKAKKAVSATTMADIARFVQMYRVNTAQYPDSWDTLVATTTTPSLPQAGTPGTGLWGLHPELTGGSPFTGPNAVRQLKLLTLTQNHVDSLNRLFITKGFDFVPPTGTTFNGYAATPRTFAVGGVLAALDGPVLGADATDKNDSIIRKIYPAGTIPTNCDLVVFGLGPNSSLISGSNNSLMLEAPFYPNQNQNQYYTRYLCVFEVRNDAAKRPRLVAVLGADGDPIADEIIDFYED